MPNLSTWINWAAAGNSESWLAQFAETPAFLLGRKGVSIVLYRNNAARTAQTMIVVPFGRGQSQEREAEAGRTGVDRLLIVGLSALDIQRGDEFSLNATGRRNYRVTNVDRTMAMTQAQAEVLDRG